MRLKKLHFIKKPDLELIEENTNKEKINRIKWIEYKQKLILYIDYSNLLITDEFLNIIQKVNNFIKKREEYNLLILVDVRNSDAKEKITVDALKNNALVVKPYVKKVAVVGVTNAQEIILTVVNMFSNLGIKPFDTFEEAKDWLVE